MRGVFIFLVVCLSASASVVDDVALRILSKQSVASSKAMATLTSNGSFSNVDYTSGCQASRAIWDAVNHWTFTSAGAMRWYQTNDTAILAAVKRAMDYWFAHDFPEGQKCLPNNGYDNCPCNTPGLWNPNWWYQVIKTPKTAGLSCVALAVRNQLSAQQKEGCVRLLNRGGLYVKKYTGANLSDTALVAVYLSIVTRDESLLLSAMDQVNRACDLVSYQDGINSDGSFIQHGGLPYFAGYGQIFAADIFDLWDTVGLNPNAAQKSAVSLFIRSSVWSIYHANGVANWDFHQMGRGVTYGPNSARYSGAWKLIQSTAQQWNDTALATAMARLQVNSSLQGVNPFKLNGVKVFYKTDYVSYRSDNFVVGLKMLSPRTYTSECYNGQGIQSQHYSDGVVYNYVNGMDYVPSQVFWGYTPPGTYVLYAPEFRLWQGLKKFVGSVSNGRTALSAMDFLSPINSQLSYKKSWHFFGGLYVVVATDIVQSKGLPVITTLDHRISRGDFSTDTGVFSVPSKTFRWLHQDLVGYYFPSPSGLTLNVSNGNVSGNWQTIAPQNVPVTAKIFKPILTTDTGSFVYVTVPGLNQKNFSSLLPTLRSSIRVIRANGDLHAVQHLTNRTLTAAFFSPGNVSFNTGKENVTIGIDAPCIITVSYGYSDNATVIHAADPTQTLTGVNVFVQCKMCVSPGDSKFNIA
ncbi:polysaccharide lyase family 8 protein, partial [Planoprotostelium fungivorum]